MALDTQNRPKRSPERAPSDGEREFEEAEAGKGAEDDAGQPGFEDDERQPAREAAKDGLDEVGRQAVDTEKRARKLGWRPQAEWTGDPGKWVDAQTWIDRVLANRPLAEDRFKKLDQQNEALAAQLAESNKRLAEVGQIVVDMSKQQKTIRQREYQRAMEDLQAKQRAAVAEGNVEAYDAAEIERKRLEKEQAEESPRSEERREAPATAGAANPVVSKWLRENPWFNTDAVLRQVADNYHKELLQTHPTLSLGENLAMVREEMVRLYPAKFPGEGEGGGEEDEPPARRAAPVHRSAITPGRQTGPKPLAQRTARDLPPEDRAVMERMVRQGVLTEKEYLANYLWEDQETRR